MPLPATLLIIATLVPLASFTLLLFVGNRMGKPLAGYVATAAIGASCVCSLWCLREWVEGGTYEPPGIPQAGQVAYGMGEVAINIPMRWVPVGPGMNQQTAGYLDIGVYIDSVTVLMFCMVSFVSTLIHVFSIGYMAEDKRFPQFFTYLNLFCFSMLGLCLGGTILQLFIFWELVGLCSYLLIGFWYEKKSASNAAIKAFVTNRVGDFGFLIGFGILFYHLGNATLPSVWAVLDISRLDPSHGIQLPGGQWIGPTLLTVMGIALFFGAVGKSAQFPLHVWLPDAMEGPTPVSALIHAATMVAAGVYLVARIFPILSPDALLFIAIIGLITLTMAALIAVAQSDIKKVLAYSTLSQLGYMVLAMGVGSWVGGLFHLITHAFFKALLFLGSGSVINAAHHEQELPQYGGLWRKIPVTALTFLIAVFAIAGVPYLSGFYSKDMILSHAGASSLLGGEHGRKWLWVFFVVPAAVAYVTAFYMMRCWMLTFAGKPRNQHLYDHAHERPVMYVPLVFLAVLSIIAGYDKTNIKGLIVSAMGESSRYVARLASGPDFKGFQQAWPVEEHGVEAEAAPAPHSPAALVAEGVELVHHYVYWAPFAGMGLGLLIYLRGYAAANWLMRIPPLRWLHRWLYRKMYFDELYMGVFIAITLLLSRISAIFDRYVIDGIVNGTASLVRRISALAGLNDRYIIDGAAEGLADAAQGLGTAVRAPQTGRIRIYVMVALAVLALVVTAAVTIAVLTQMTGARLASGN